MQRIAYLTGRSWRGEPIAAGELPSLEAQDFPLIELAGREAGLGFDVVYWDDPDLAQRGFDAAVIRSCWDYPERTEDFIATLTKLEEQGLRLFNSSRLVAWNARKTYLRALAEAGVATIPTLYVEALSADAVSNAFEVFDCEGLVIKPVIGAGGVRTIRLERRTWRPEALAEGPLGAAMLQPFLPSIVKGELALFCFGGQLAHAVMKTPAPGGWLANAHDVIRTRGEPNAAQRAAAEAAVAAAPEPMLYARIDLVEGADGRPLVIELEAIEPYFYLYYAPEGVQPFIRALKGVL